MTIPLTLARVVSFLIPRHGEPRIESDHIRIVRLRICFLIVFTGFCAAGIFYYFQAIYLGRHFPFNTFLSVPQAHFSDYANMLSMCRDLNPYHSESRSGYPPLANLFYFAFSKLPGNIGEVLYFLIPLIFLFWGTYRRLTTLPPYYKLQAALVLLISYPILFAVDRGNLDLWIMVCLGVFLTNYTAKDSISLELANIALAIAIALKLYPILFLLLYVKDRRFIGILKIALICSLATIAASALFAGGAPNAIKDFMGMLSTTDSLVTQKLEYGSSNVGIYYAGKILVELFHLNLDAKEVAMLYKRCAIVILLLSCGAVLVKQLEFWSSAVCIVCLTCLVPTLSNDYRMVNFLFPLILIVNARTLKPISALTAIVVISLLMVPKNYYLFFPEIARGDIGIADILNPLLIGVLLLALLLDPEPKSPVDAPEGAFSERTKSLILSALFSAFAFILILGLREWLAPEIWQSLNNWGTWLLLLSIPFLGIHVYCVMVLLKVLGSRHINPKKQNV
jgi:hypothetical protein